MIDPILSLALSMHSNPGVYALLLGSGVSRSAGIPTGWEIVIDLIEKLASLENTEPTPDPESWYVEKHGETPTYSALLGIVAKTQAERAHLLRSYFEPTENERNEGRKLPTRAHLAIAQLVKLGKVKVILTTNFDRLIEQALGAEGIEPTVIASVDDIDGAMPLVHSGCVVIKIHGDYLDLRIRNTPTELDEYDENMDSLIDRVLDEFGLVIAGWSAEWDTALVRAIRRTKGRRFTTYWTTRGGLKDVAEQLATQRGAELIKIKDADSFFESLVEKVHVLDEMDSPHPLSINAAIAQTKRYIADPRLRIHLHDLLLESVGETISCITSNDYPVQEEFNEQEFIRRVTAFESAVAVGVSIIATGAYWGTEDHCPFWIKALERLNNSRKDRSGSKIYLGIQAYPCLLMLYAAGIGAAASGNLDTICSLLMDTQPSPKATDGYFPIAIHEHVNQSWFRAIPGIENKILARTVRMEQVLRDALKPIIPNELEFVEAFDTFETLQSIQSVQRTGIAMPGAFMYRYYRIRNGKPILIRDGSPLLAYEEEVGKWGGRASILEAGFAGRTFAEWEKAVHRIHETTSEMFR